MVKQACILQSIKINAQTIRPIVFVPVVFVNDARHRLYKLKNSRMHDNIIQRIESPRLRMALHRPHWFNLLFGLSLILPAVHTQLLSPIYRKKTFELNRTLKV